MRLRVISATIQEFDGLRYYKCGEYFQRAGKRLHIVVWEAYYGPRPPRVHVHHIDRNKSHNAHTNLGALAIGPHVREHMEDPGRREQLAAVLRLSWRKARRWHRSRDGRLWHREHYDDVKESLHKKRYHHWCAQCGEKFYSNLRVRSKFCGRNCKAQWRRVSGVDVRIGAGPSTEGAEKMVVSVEPFERRDVFTLTVPGVGAFALANGVVVSNCDAFGYVLWQMFNVLAKHIPAVAPVVTDQSDFYNV